MKTSFAFFGTPSVAVWVLEELEAAGQLPAVVVTAPDKPAGRGMNMTPSPVKVWAEERKIPVLQPEKLNQAFRDALTAYGCDVFVVAAYGKIMSQKVLSLAPQGCLNMHPSILPKYRGAAPIESQILADEQDVGVSIMVMDEEMDHGPIVSQEHVQIPGWPIGRLALSELLARTGGRMLARILPSVDVIAPVPQNHALATYTRKIAKEDGLIDPNGPARENYLKYCAYEGWPGLYFFVQKDWKDIRVKVTKASYQNDAFVIEQVIPEGKKEMTYEEFRTRY